MDLLQKEEHLTSKRKGESGRAGGLGPIADEAITNDFNNNSDIDLICRVCHTHYQNPKLLPCLHTFCERCLNKCVYNIQENSYIRCPLCGTLKKTASKLLDEKDVCFDELNTDFVALNILNTCAINHIDLENVHCSNCTSRARAQSLCSECSTLLCINCQRVHKKRKLTKNHRLCSLALLSLPANQPLHAGDYCRTHVGQKTTLFCKSCNRVVCNDCTLLDHARDEHTVTELSDVSPYQRRQLAELLHAVQKRVPFLKRTLNDVDSVLKAIPDHADAVAREIAKTTEHLIKFLRHRQDVLLDELTKLCAHKSAVLHEQKSRIQSELKILDDNSKTTKRILQNGSSSEIATVETMISDRLQFLRNMKLDMEVDENAEFGYESGFEELKNEIMRCGKIFPIDNSDPLKIIGEGLQEASVGKYVAFNMAKSEKYELSHHRDIDVRIETPDSVLLQCDVIHSRDLFTVVYNPKVPGEHEISIIVRSEHLPDSPYSVNVKAGHANFLENSVKLSTFGDRGNAPGYFNAPSDIAVRNNGDVLIADASNHRVQVLNPKSRNISCFGEEGTLFGQLSYPSGIAISRLGHVIVCDHGNHRVQMFTFDGVYLQSFGGYGDDEGLMKRPTGVAVDLEGRILIVDQQNHRVQVFDESGEYLHHFGCHGYKQGELRTPMYVAVSPDNDIYVTDTGNDRVVIFDAHGCHHRTIGRPGKEDGEFIQPTGITIDGAGYIYVSDQSGRVQVFDSEHQFVTDLQSKSNVTLECPVGIDYTPEGNIIVADKSCHNLVMFSCVL